MKVLVKSNLKKTKGREQIISIIRKSSLPLSAEEIHKQCIKHGSVNLSTVYRTLSTLVEKGFLIKSVRQNGVAYYQENSHDHVHLIVCTNCGKKLTLDICPLEKLLLNIARETNFSLTSHNIELYGLCPNCKGA